MQLWAMSQNAAELRLEDLEIKPHLITKLKNAGIESIFDLGISLPHDLIDVGGGILSGPSEDIALARELKERDSIIEKCEERIISIENQLEEIKKARVQWKKN